MAGESFGGYLEKVPAAFYVNGSPDGSQSAPKGTNAIDTTTGITWKNRNGSTRWDPIEIPVEYGYRSKDDFFPEMGAGIARAGIAGGATGLVAGNANQLGVVQLFVTAVNDGAVIRAHNAGQGIYFGGGVLDWRAGMRIPTLSDGTQNLCVRGGWGDAVSSATDNVDGVYFECDLSAHANNNWWLCAANNSTRTKTDTGIAASTGYQVLELRVNASGTQVDGWIDGVAVTPLTTNIPVLGSRTLTELIQVLKTLGGTLREVDVDWIDRWVVYSTAKFTP